MREREEIKRRGSGRGINNVVGGGEGKGVRGKKEEKRERRGQTRKGADPVRHWKMIVPMLHRSALPSYLSPSRTSGAYDT